MADARNPDQDKESKGAKAASQQPGVIRKTSKVARPADTETQRVGRAQMDAAGSEGPRLVLVKQGFVQVVFPIAGRGQTIGRGPGCSIVLADERASKKHARVGFEGDDVIIEDFGSLNG